MGPIIKTQDEEEEGAENCRLSSDTFITSPAPPILSVIHQEHSSQMTVGRSQLGSESIQQDRQTFTEKLTPARPRRSTIAYTTQNIEDIASPKKKRRRRSMWRIRLPQDLCFSQYPQPKARDRNENL